MAPGLQIRKLVVFRSQLKASLASLIFFLLGAGTSALAQDIIKMTTHPQEIRGGEEGNIIVRVETLPGVPVECQFDLSIPLDPDTIFVPEADDSVGAFVPGGSVREFQFKRKFDVVGAPFAQWGFCTSTVDGRSWEEGTMIRVLEPEGNSPTSLSITTDSPIENQKYASEEVTFTINLEDADAGRFECLARTGELTQVTLDDTIPFIINVPQGQTSGQATIRHKYTMPAIDCEATGGTCADHFGGRGYRFDAYCTDGQGGGASDSIETNVRVAPGIQPPSFSFRRTSSNVLQVGQAASFVLENIVSQSDQLDCFFDIYNNAAPVLGWSGSPREEFRQAFQLSAPYSSRSFQVTLDSSKYVGHQVANVTCRDGHGNAFRDSQTVRVEPVPGNRSPAITATSSVTKNEAGLSAVFVVYANDPDGDLLECKVSVDDHFNDDVRFTFSPGESSKEVQLSRAFVGDFKPAVECEDRRGGQVSTFAFPDLAEIADGSPNLPDNLPANGVALPVNRRRRMAPVQFSFRAFARDWEGQRDVECQGIGGTTTFTAPDYRIRTLPSSLLNPGSYDWSCSETDFSGGNRLPEILEFLAHVADPLNLDDLNLEFPFTFRDLDDTEGVCSLYFGDGHWQDHAIQASIGSKTGAHRYASPGSYNVQLKCCDEMTSGRCDESTAINNGITAQEKQVYVGVANPSGMAPIILEARATRYDDDGPPNGEPPLRIKFDVSLGSNATCVLNFDTDDKDPVALGFLGRTTPYIGTHIYDLQPGESSRQWNATLECQSRDFARTTRVMPINLSLTENRPPTIQEPTFDQTELQSGDEVEITVFVEDDNGDSVTCTMDFGDGSELAGMDSFTPPGPYVPPYASKTIRHVYFTVHSRVNFKPVVTCSDGMETSTQRSWAGVIVSSVDRDGDGHPHGLDCDDMNPNVNPLAEEVCDDGIDNNCDGKIDYNDRDCSENCFDVDGDGVLGGILCDLPVEVLDCNDNNPNIFPGATEVCDDGIDNDCNGRIDFADVPACIRDCRDLDRDGAWIGADCPASTPIDCNDNNPDIRPSVSGRPDIIEVCSDGIDNNCDGLVDQADTNACSSDCEDADGDDAWVGLDCVDKVLDCDDLDPEVNPNATEINDGIDNNCDGSVDETNNRPQAMITANPLSGMAPFVTTISCNGIDSNAGDVLTRTLEVLGNTIVSNEGPAVVDANFAEAGNYVARCTVNDGWNGGIDTRDLTIVVEERDDPDEDGDGFGISVDCDDTNPNINPDAIELNDGVDNNCVDGIDETNRDPFMRFTARPPMGTAPLTVTFRCPTSDFDGDQITHTWTDGRSDFTPWEGVVRRTYNEPGIYEAVCQAEDGFGGETVLNQMIYVLDPEITVGDESPIQLNVTPIRVTDPDTEVTFEASIDGVGPNDLVTYHWLFGDGSLLVETQSSVMKHTYKNSGRFGACVSAEIASGPGLLPPKCVRVVVTRGAISTGSSEFLDGSESDSDTSELSVIQSSSGGPFGCQSRGGGASGGWMIFVLLTSFYLKNFRASSHKSL